MCDNAANAARYRRRTRSGGCIVAQDAWNAPSHATHERNKNKRCSVRRKRGAEACMVAVLGGRATHEGGGRKRAQGEGSTAHTSRDAFLCVPARAD